VIERKVLDKTLAEQNFSNSDRADPSSRPRSENCSALTRSSSAASPIRERYEEHRHRRRRAGLAKVGIGGPAGRKPRRPPVYRPRRQHHTAEIPLAPKARVNPSARAPFDAVEAAAGAGSVPEASISAAAISEHDHRRR
jgi:hypothetical protein